MEVTLKLSNLKSLPVSNEIPERLAEYHIPGSKVVSAKGKFGTIMLQIIDLDGFSWMYNIFELRSEVSFVFKTSNPSVISRISLENDFEHNINLMGDFSINESQFNIFYTDSLHTTSILKKGRYSSIDIIYPSDYVLQTLNFFPVFEQFAKNIKENIPSIISNKKVYASASIMDSVYKLIHSPFSFNVRTFHLDILKQLLTKMLQQTSELHTFSKKFSVSEVERIHEAKQYIDENLPKHFNIFQIARHVGLNDQKLKSGFKQVFGIGLYGYLQSQILDIAKLQLEQTAKSVNEIAAMTGYSNANNFSAAFKKKFGLTPLNWRKTNHN